MLGSRRLGVSPGQLSGCPGACAPARGPLSRGPGARPGTWARVAAACTAGAYVAGTWVAVASLVVPAPAAAAGIGVQGSGGTITFGGSGGTPGAQSPGGTLGGGSGGPVYLAYEPSLGQAPGLGPCVSTTTMPFSDPTQAAAVSESYGEQWYLLIVRYPMCPAATPAVTLNPSGVAGAWWSAHGANLLSSPDPVIAPGFGLTGLAGYLQARMPIEQTFTDPTPLGDLVVHAEAGLWVDWGDGSGLDGPYGTAGGPWPSGGIVHTWDHSGSYQVVVQARWSATWSLAGSEGALGGLHTTGSIPAFAVEDVVSVRNR